jgi:hypothetical protein
MKPAHAIAAFAAAFALPAAAQSTVPNVVFLDRPGVLAQIERENPDHFRRITGIIEASAQACRRDEIGEQLRVKYEAVKTSCGALIKTSYPAKFTLGFELDQTRYVVTATQPQDEKLVAVPAKR